MGNRHIRRRQIRRFCSCSRPESVSPERWHVIAPDWRGHGGSHRTGETYPFLQFIADLDAVLEHFSPNEPVCIAGHSLGANVSTVYAGIRPERVARLINLEGVAPVPRLWKGTPAHQLGNWLASLRRGVRNRAYRDRAALAGRLREANPRLTAERADFLAREFSRERTDGAFEFDMDSYQNARAPVIGREQVVESTWPRITAPMLLVTGADSDIFKSFNETPGVFERRLGLLPNVEYVKLREAGHNMHHDQPEQIASLIENFLTQQQGLIGNYHQWIDGYCLAGKKSADLTPAAHRPVVDLGV